MRERIERGLDGIARPQDGFDFIKAGHESGSTVKPRHCISQVKEEIMGLVDVLLEKGLNGKALEIGLGTYGGTHRLWELIFEDVVSVEIYITMVCNFRRRFKTKGRIVIGDSRKAETIRRVGKISKRYDFLFIDGNHKFESVLCDTLNYKKLIRDGGIIAWHDSVCKLPGHGVYDFLMCYKNGIIDGTNHEVKDLVFSERLGISYEVVRRVEEPNAYVSREARALNMFPYFMRLFLVRIWLFLKFGKEVK